MKVFAILTITLVLTGAHAGFLDEFKATLQSIGDNIKNVYAGVKPLLSSAVGKLVGELKTTGSQILAQGAQALLASLNGGNTTTRDVDLLDKVGQFIKNGESSIATLSHTIGNLFNAAVAKLIELAGELENAQLFGQPISKYISEIEEVVSSHNFLQSSILKQLIEQPTKLLSSAAQHLMGHKRNAVDGVLSSIGQQLASTFKPTIDTLKLDITDLVNTLKNTGPMVQYPLTLPPDMKKLLLSTPFTLKPNILHNPLKDIGPIFLPTNRPPTLTSLNQLWMKEPLGINNKLN